MAWSQATTAVWLTWLATQSAARLEAVAGAAVRLGAGFGAGARDVRTAATVPAATSTTATAATPTTRGRLARALRPAGGYPVSAAACPVSVGHPPSAGQPV